MASSSAPRYTGVGSRTTPPEVLRLFTKLANRFEQLGWVLRSGHAGGADAAFESGVSDPASPDMAEIYLPWPGFNGGVMAAHTLATPEAWVRASAMAGEVHHLRAEWAVVKRSVRALHARNVFQVLGPRLDQPSDLLVCWTPAGEAVGGTATAIRLAKQHGVPVVNFGEPGAMDRLAELVRARIGDAQVPRGG